VARKARRRRERFVELLPDNLQMLTSTLRSGYGLLQALDNVAQEAEEPARSEFQRVLVEIRFGRDPGEALHALADRVESEDFRWVVGAIEINREIGGDLAVILDNVATTIRERQRLVRQVQTLTAEGRISAYVLIGLPIVMALLMSLINPGYLEPLLEGVGLAINAVGAALLLTGWLWMRRLIRTDY
jgi:tight adherence protein B